MSGSLGTGSLLSGAGSLITAVGSLFPTTTDTSSSSSGTASSNTQSGQAGVATSSTTATGTTNQTAGSNTITSNQSSTVNSADPGVIAALKSLAAIASANASNATGNTSNLVTGLFQAAKDSFASTFSQGAGAGLYNSSTTGVLQDAAEARASADAASAVLGYQTQEQQVAQGALQSLLSATATQTTSGTQQTQVAQFANSSTTDTQDTTQTNASTATQATKQKQQQQATSTSTTSKSSIVCTWMYRSGFLERDKFLYSYKDFQDNYSDLGREAYTILATKIVKYLNLHMGVLTHNSGWKSSLARLFITLFKARTEQVCWELKYPGARFSLKNWAAKKLVYCCVFPVGLWLHGKCLFLGKSAPQCVRAKASLFICGSEKGN